MIIELQVRHYKTYNGMHTIPIAYKSDFVTYVGENGIGKSSIFEAMDSLFNKKVWNINLKASSGGGFGNRNNPYIVGVFSLKKSEIKSNLIIYEKIDEFLRNEKSYEAITKKLDNDELLTIAGKLYHTNKQPDACFGASGFDKKIKDIIFSTFSEDDKEKHKEANQKTINKIERKYFDISEYILNLHSYIYIPVEMDIKEFSTLVNSEMQKLTGKDIRKEIEDIITEPKLKEINTSLNSLVANISDTLDIFKYDFKSAGKKRIFMPALVSIIIEEYFDLRILKKGDVEVSNLSSGEKRKALVELSKSLLEAQIDIDENIILAIDEPEASLSITKCYFQFEELYNLSKNSPNLQVLITTHWYGHLPIIKDGIAHFLSEKSENKIEFSSFEFQSYYEKSKKITLPEHVSLKSKNDLVQSIVASLRIEENPYNWLICEGSSDKIYLEYFLKEEIEKYNLRILPLGGDADVTSIFKYLLLPLEEKSTINGRVFCLIDTDKEIHKYKKIPDSNLKNIVIERFENDNDKKEATLKKASSLITNLNPTAIENVLDKDVFLKSLKEILNDVENTIQQNTINMIINDPANFTEYNNSYYCFSVRDVDRNTIDNFISLKKVKLAKKYVELCHTETPDLPWVEKIKSFFKGN